MPQKPRVTQAYLAEEAGVTQVTVSLALRNDPSISEETRERIHKLAKKHGYRPDPALSSLVAYRSSVRAPAFHGTLTWLNMTDYKDAYESWAGWSDFYQGACDRASQLGYRIEGVWANEPGMSLRRIKQILRSRGTRGVILPPAATPRLDQIVDIESTSVIRLGDYSMMASDYHLVAADHRWAIERVLTEIRDRGYRKVAYASFQAFESRLNHTYLSAYIGWQKTQKKLKLARPFYAEKYEREAYIKWFEKEKPDVLIMPNNQKIEEGVDWIKEDLGLEAPKDFGLAYTCLPINRQKAWSGVDEGYSVIGARTIDMLVDMINRNEIGLPERPIRHLIHGVWEEGQTLPNKK